MTGRGWAYCTGLVWAATFTESVVTVFLALVAILFWRTEPRLP